MLTPITPATRSGYWRAMIHTSNPPQSWPAITNRSWPNASATPDQTRVDPLAVVRDVGFVAAAVAGQVGRDHMEAGLAERRDLMPPRVRQLGEAVQQQHQGPVERPRLEAEETDPVGRHVAAAHGPTLTAADGGNRELVRIVGPTAIDVEGEAMKTYQATTTAALAVVAVIGLAACGSGSTKTATPKVEVVTAPAAATATGPTISVAGHGTGARASPTPRP